jgi:hypothetical protein
MLSKKCCFGQACDPFNMLRRLHVELQWREPA